MQYEFNADAEAWRSHNARFGNSDNSIFTETSADVNINMSVVPNSPLDPSLGGGAAYQLSGSQFFFKKSGDALLEINRGARLTRAAANSSIQETTLGFSPMGHPQGDYALFNTPLPSPL
jgi:hypothetical protein